MVAFRHGAGVAMAKTASTSTTEPTAVTAPITGPVRAAGVASYRSASARTGSGSGRRSAARPGPRSRTSSRTCTQSWTRACGPHMAIRSRGGGRLAGRGPAGPDGEDGRGQQGRAAAPARQHREHATAGPDRPRRTNRAGKMAATHATRTVQKAHNCLTRAIRHAEGQDLVRRNVSALVDTPRGQEGRPSQSLTLEQAAALLGGAEKSRLHAFIALCLLTGVRSEEARALTWEHVDLKAGTVSVWRSVRAHGDTKTERSRRTLKLPATAVKALRAQRSTRPRSAPEPGSCGKSTAWYSPRQWGHRLNRTTCGAISARSPRRPESASAGCQRNFGPRSSA